MNSGCKHKSNNLCILVRHNTISYVVDTESIVALESKLLNIVPPMICCFYSYRRAALQMWKQKLGSKATYDNLISVFKCAGYQGYADTVYKGLGMVRPYQLDFMFLGQIHANI